MPFAEGMAGSVARPSSWARLSAAIFSLVGSSVAGTAGGSSRRPMLVDSRVTS